MTLKERFFPFTYNGSIYAPSTIGAPKFLNPVDQSVFEKNKDEKLDAKVIKSIHKKGLEKVYGVGRIGKHLNVPEKEQSKVVVSF